MNNRLWRVIYVDPQDPRLVDRTRTRTVAVTDASTNSIYIRRDLTGDFLYTVIIHELGHCAMISYNLFDEIHRMVKPEYWIEAEEWICNFVANYGYQIFSAAYRVLGDDALMVIPRELEKLVS